MGGIATFVPYSQPAFAKSSGQRVRASRSRRSPRVSSGTAISNGVAVMEPDGLSPCFTKRYGRRELTAGGRSATTVFRTGAPKSPARRVKEAGMGDVVRSELNANVRCVTLDNPGKNNALDRPAMAALGEMFRFADADDETRVVVLSGAGRAFCAGADLVAAQKSLRQGDGTPRSVQDGSSQDSEFNATIRALWSCRKPVIAAVNGVAAGFGCSLVLASDVRIASSAARLSLVFVKRGLALDGGASFFLPRLAGLNGLEMALTGDVVSAEEAARLGLVNRVVAEAEFRDHVARFAQK